MTEKKSKAAFAWPGYGGLQRQPFVVVPKVACYRRYPLAALRASLRIASHYPNVWNKLYTRQILVQNKKRQCR